MARKYAQISLDVWADPDFRQLSHGAQWLYWLLISQPTVTAAGVLPLQERRWATLAADTSRVDVEALLVELDSARYVLVDVDTEEVLIRSYLRNGQGWRQPNLAKTAMVEARQIISSRLRVAMVEELCRIPFDTLTGGRSDATRELVRETIAALSPRGGPDLPGWDSGTHPGRDSGTHGGPHSGSTEQPMGDPIDPTDGTGTGTGTGTTSVGGSSSLQDDEKTRTITENSTATPAQAHAVLDYVRATHRPTALGAWLRTVAARGDMQDLVDSARAARAPAAPRPRDRARCPDHLLALPCGCCAADAKADPNPSPAPVRPGAAT